MTYEDIEKVLYENLQAKILESIKEIIKEI